jgi:hypothetical protein
MASSSPHPRKDAQKTGLHGVLRGEWYAETN